MARYPAVVADDDAGHAARQHAAAGLAFAVVDDPGDLRRQRGARAHRHHDLIMSV
jgi:hypothetical protein